VTSALLPRRRVREIVARRGQAVHDEALRVVTPIVEDVRARGEVAVRSYAEQLDALAAGGPLYLDRAALERALDGLTAADRARLERVAQRIRTFAEAERRACGEVEVRVSGGVAAERLAPVERAGCYVPGGRHPLPSSVLMTVIPARIAGVTDVWVASPRPQPLSLAAAAVAGADGVLAGGGAQAIAALAYGCGPMAARDLIVGPGNAYVTAAKYLVSRHVAIDMLAGPSEVVIIADETADARLVAADLLAQAEHDPEAVPVLITTCEPLVAAVEAELRAQLATLATAATARAALGNGGAVVVRDLNEAARASDALAPEHVQVVARDAEPVAARLRHYGAVFVGAVATEVLGDYGAGPNHTLPTGGTARGGGALSVATFLRRQTSLRVVDAAAARELVEDAAWFAAAEGLEGHARAAGLRLVVA
jgi:phosphoribosyl-ATP pyrophosphohydrolase/phosphoribosyl-AMP cyclohydrolase/histidinol dehydrogenase